MFYGCSSLISFPDITKWKIDNVSFMTNMFSECTSIISFPHIDKWLLDVIMKKIRVYDIFKDCSSLICIPNLDEYSKELWLIDDKNDMRQYSRYDWEHKTVY